MINVKGKWNDAVIYSDVPDEKSIEQIRNLLDQKYFAGNKVRIMPDYHYGAGCTIGLTASLVSKRISPNLVGVDIGCGMLAVKIYGLLDFDKLDALIRERVPSGFSIHNRPHWYSKYIMTDVEEMSCVDSINLHRAKHSVGTLGGGNHFIEVAQGETGVWLVIHSGSRNLGKQTADHYQNLAIKSVRNRKAYLRERGIAEMKEENRHDEIEEWLVAFELTNPSVPDSLAYVSGLDFDAYIRDMTTAQLYADLNRHAMADTIISGMEWTEIDRFTSVHNYIDTDDMIMRKGACSAKKGERLIIPINMRDGSIIAVGKGNEEWNNSAPHGAGRSLGRGQARRTLSMEKFESEMDGIYTTSVSKDTLDESPMAYKGKDYIMRNIRETVDIVDVIKPLYNFKAS